MEERTAFATEAKVVGLDGKPVTAPGPTPGPWRAFRNHVYWEIRTASAEWEGQQIGDACASGHMFRRGERVADHGEANARLMAAAPELLAALLDLIAPCAGFTEHDLQGRIDLSMPARKVLAARQAIAKAGGR